MRIKSATDCSFFSNFSSPNIGYRIKYWLEAGRRVQTPVSAWKYIKIFHLNLRRQNAFEGIEHIHLTCLHSDLTTVE